MTPKERNKVKSTRLRYLAVLPAILIVLTGVFLVGKYGLPFGSQLGNNQRQAETTHAQNKWAECIELPGLPNLHKVSDDLYRGAQHGADRTGTMCAIYRIAVQGWSKDEAAEEMTKGGFGFHSFWQNLPDYINQVNIVEIKQSASLKE